MPTPELASIDGAISLTTEARVPVADDGLLRGDGAFEVVRLYGGRPYALDEHLIRLRNSATAIELDFDGDALRGEIETLLTELGAIDGQLRILVTRGGRRIAMTEPLPPRLDTVTVATVTYSPSIILNGVKSLSYAANMEATRLAKARGADEAIFVTPDGTVLEAPTSTLFWVSPQGQLRTSSLDTGVLASITRARIIEALDVEAGAWPVEDLRGATEAFLASSTREVQPIAAIDDAKLAAVPGPRSEEAATAFAATRDEALGESS